MQLDKGKKVTTGATLTTAAAAVLVWVFGLMGIVIDTAAALGLITLAAFAGGAVFDWATEDDGKGD